MRKGDRTIMGQHVMCTILEALNRLFITLWPSHALGVKYQRTVIGNEGDIFIVMVNVCAVVFVITCFRLI